MNAHEILPYFCGKWSIDRDISIYGRVHGEASFARVSGKSTVLRYFEEVNLHTGKGHRQYLYKFENDQVNVYFDDGENKGDLFHKLSLDSDDSATGDHLCKKDFYRCIYSFISEDSFSIQYTVVGPKKDYTIETVYSRQS